MPLATRITHLVNEIGRLRAQVAELKKPTSEQTALEKREQLEQAREDRRRDREERRERQSAAELQSARAAAIRAIAKLLPEAIAQAKAKPPRPALLRLILRATR
jgi:DNA-binding protein H-NS